VLRQSEEICHAKVVSSIVNVLPWQGGRQCDWRSDTHPNEVHFGEIITPGRDDSERRQSGFFLLFLHFAKGIDCSNMQR